MPEKFNDFNQKLIDEFRDNAGTVTSAPFGRTLVLVHHVGAKSGKERITPTMHVRRDADTWLIAASKAGAPDNPAWFHNLKANPETVIETPDDGTVEVVATELTGAERDAGWQQFLDLVPGFREYEQRTTRVIPVIALTRR